MTEDRPHRPALSASAAASQLVDDVDAGRFGSVEVDAVLDAAGQPVRPMTTSHPAGLTDREVEVLRLIARGYANKQVAATLGIYDQDGRPPRRAHLRQGRGHHPCRGDAVRHGARPAVPLSPPGMG